MASGGISPSGRFLRWTLWRLPVGATRYAMARNMALFTEEGRRWLILAGFGFWVWVTWQVARLSGIQGVREFAAFLTLFWFWRLFANVRRVYAHRRNLKAMAVSIQRQREMYELLTKLPGQLQQVARQGIPGGITTMRTSMRHHDPDDAEHQARARQQAEDVRAMLPPEQRDLPLGDGFEPIFKLPKWLRRKPK